MDITLLTVPTQLGENQSLSRNASAQTIQRSNSQFRLQLPIAPGAFEEALSQASTARVSTVLGTQTFHNPLSVVPPYQHTRAMSQPPIRGAGHQFSPYVQTRSTLNLRQTQVATAHDIDVGVDRMVEKMERTFEQVVQGLAEKGYCACKAPDPRAEAQALAKLKTDHTDICTLRLAIRECEEAGVSEKDIGTYRTKLEEMVRADKEAQAKKDDELRKVQNELARVRSEYQKFQSEIQQLKNDASQKENDLREQNKQLATSEKRGEEIKAQLKLMQRKVEDAEAEKRSLKAQIEQIRKEENLKCSKLAAQNQSLLEREKENIQQVQKANAEQQALQSKVSEELQQGKAQISSLKTQIRDSEQYKKEMSEHVLDLERKLNVKASAPAATPSEIFRMMKTGDRNMDREIPALEARNASLESLIKVAEAQHQVLWSFVPKEAALAVEQKLRALKRAPNY